MEDSLAGEEPVPRTDTATYLFDLAGELAGIAHRAGLPKVAAAFELARAFSAETVAEAHTGNAAAGDAA